MYSGSRQSNSYRVNFLWNFGSGKKKFFICFLILCRREYVVCDVVSWCCLQMNASVVRQRLMSTSSCASCSCSCWCTSLVGRVTSSASRQPGHNKRIIIVSNVKRAAYQARSEICSKGESLSATAEPKISHFKLF